MFGANKVLFIVTIMGLLLVGGQPVQPAAAAEMEPEIPAEQIRATFDFTVPEWGLEHGWVFIDMPISDVEDEVAEGFVRWVEVNDDQEVRYVVAVPKCVTLSEDGQAAMVTVEITDRWGWGEGEPGQWMQFWLNEAGNEFASPLFPPSDVDPGCEYEAPVDTIPLTMGRIEIQAPAYRSTAAQPVETEPTGLHQIQGQFGFPSPEYWGVDLWITQYFDITELDPLSHEATGMLNFGVYDVDLREWKRVKSDVKYALFDEPGEAAMVISQITEKTGSGEGEPGEYALFWVRDGGAADQFGIHYYSDFHPEAGFKEYFPADELPPLEYAEPASVIDVEAGDLTIVPGEKTSLGSEPEGVPASFPEIAGEVFIPAGPFHMGCDEENPAENCRNVELPLHTVYLDNYYIDKFEVTNARYQACIDAGVCEPPSQEYSSSRDSYFGNPEFDEYPVLFVDWFQAEAFCLWEGKRLPTEAEWVKAARGSQDTRKYPWGDEAPICELSNHWGGTDGCAGDTLAVGTLPEGASPYGVMNMAGNVAEWVNDWYADDYYSVSESENPAGPEDGSTKTLMDGAFEVPATSSDNTSRIGFSPNTKWHWLGFRCAHSP